MHFHERKTVYTASIFKFTPVKVEKYAHTLVKNLHEITSKYFQLFSTKFVTSMIALELVPIVSLLQRVWKCLEMIPVCVGGVSKAYKPQPMAWFLRSVCTINSAQCQPTPPPDAHNPDHPRTPPPRPPKLPIPRLRPLRHHDPKAKRCRTILMVI